MPNNRLVDLSDLVVMRCTFLRERGEAPNCLLLPIGIKYWTTDTGGRTRWPVRCREGDLLLGLRVMFTPDVKEPTPALQVIKGGTTVYY